MKAALAGLAAGLVGFVTLPILLVLVVAGGGAALSPGGAGGGSGSGPGGSDGTAATVVAFAYSVLGAPYRWGGDGSDGTYDCSGLTMRAYATAGIALPRVAADQYRAGPPLVPGATLEPGDLVFFGPDVSDPATISHVGIYVGSGDMIDAPHTGEVVRVEPLWGDYVGATRPWAAR